MAKVLMKGNEAIAEAAIKAGCLNYFGYPITPQSEVGEYLAKRLPEVGGVFLQGESEVAVVYMVFGASGAGARVFTTSSSPGISLMSEGISYIAAAQCPAVFVNIMRGGPGLGGILPSQADYFQATRGIGHGGCRLLVMAPNGVQEAVDMTMKAFILAEKYRNPVMILGDGMIGQMMEPVEFPVDFDCTKVNNDTWATTGMMNRNNSKKRNLVKSLFLDPKKLNEHNLVLKAKYDLMEKQEISYELYNVKDNYKFLIVSYGTMSRICKTAIDLLKKKYSVDVGMVRPKNLFPFPYEIIEKLVDNSTCKQVFSIEMSMGQMVDDVKSAAKGICPVKWYGKCGGEPPTPEEIVDFILSEVSN